METFKLRNFTLVSSHLLFFTLLTCNLTATYAQLNPLQGNVCKWVNCGQGTCQATTDGSFPGFQCNCAPGWTKFKIGGGFEFPSCVLPNCSVNLQCGNEASLGPPPPPPALLPNFSDPCMFTSCLDGTCERNGTEFSCQCSEGSTNLMNNPKFPCFRKCSLGADCQRHLGFVSPDLHPPISSPSSASSLSPFTSPLPSPPSRENSTSPDTGSGEMLNSSSHFHKLAIVILLATVFLANMDLI